eukprot:5416397-Alexandrium_andersonii.AAC.1
MSASLVGSEMCIRDRLERERLVATRAAALGPETEAHLPGVRGSASVAVSYTHLTLPTICSV